MFAPGQDKSMRVTNPGRQGFINLGELEARRSVRLWDKRVRFANRSSHFVIERMASMLGSEKLMAFVGTREPQRAKVFYRETLGLELVNEDEFALAFEVNGIMLRVTTVQQVVTAPYTVLGWQVSSARDIAEKLKDAGVELQRYPFLVQDDLGIWTAPGGAQIAWFKDPDGNLLSVAQL